MFTDWFDQLSALDQVDWTIVYQRYWADNIDDPDRQRRKQAEFLVHRFCDWSHVKEIVVIDQRVKTLVEEILSRFPARLHRPVVIRRDWYYH